MTNQKEYLVANYKETAISPRTAKNHAKFFKKEHIYNDRDSNIQKKKYIANYVKGELRTNIDFNTPDKVSNYH